VQIETDKGSRAWLPNHGGLNPRYVGDETILKVSNQIKRGTDCLEVKTCRFVITAATGVGVMHSHFFPNETIEQVQAANPQSI